MTRLGTAISHASLPEQNKAVLETDFVSGFTQAGFEKAVQRSLEYIRAGDIMQVVLSQRLTIPFAASPLDLYRALRILREQGLATFAEHKLTIHDVAGLSRLCDFQETYLIPRPML